MQANYIDCRISAYPPNPLDNPNGTERFLGLRIATPKNVIVIIDLDKSSRLLKSEQALESALIHTLLKIDSALGVEPTVLWSGNGYHVYLVMDCQPNLENVKQFCDLGLQKGSLQFLRFAEHFLSEGKSDKAHNTTVSFRNCMMRIPGSINSKKGSEVLLFNEWNGARTAINYLLRDFCVYIANGKAQELITRRKTQINTNNTRSKGTASIFSWIEKLVTQIWIVDGRKYCVWRILVPYLLNRKHVSQEECTTIISEWLEQCSQLERLDFDPNQKIKDAIKRVGDYGPLHPQKLRQDYPDSYNLLAENKVLK